MALDRTWFNTLVDDDGSNTVGSVWNKSSVDHVYDDVDAELVRLIGPRQSVTPVVQTAEGLTCALVGGAVMSDFAIVGDQCFYRFFIQGIAVLAPTAHLRVWLGTLPPVPVPKYETTEEAFVRIYAPSQGGSQWGYGGMSTSGYVRVYRGAEATFVADTTALMSTGWYFIR